MKKKKKDITPFQYHLGFSIHLDFSLHGCVVLASYGYILCSPCSTSSSPSSSWYIIPCSWGSISRTTWVLGGEWGGGWGQLDLLFLMGLATIRSSTLFL